MSEIDGKNNPQEASAKLINFSFFSQKFASWISDLNPTKYAIAASLVWSFIIWGLGIGPNAQCPYITNF